MQIEITEDDIKDAADPRTIAEIQGIKPALGVDGSRPRAIVVADLLPRAIAKRVSRMVPDRMELAELTLSLSVGGTPFGVGISGDVEIKLVPTEE